MHYQSEKLKLQNKAIMMAVQRVKQDPGLVEQVRGIKFVDPAQCHKYCKEVQNEAVKVDAENLKLEREISELEKEV